MSGPQKHIAELERLDDLSLVTRYRHQQDPEVIGVLFTRYTHLVFGTCYNILEDKDAASDAVMQVFEGLFDSLLKTEVRHFSSWLYQVSRNHCLMEVRKKATDRKARERIKAEITGENVEYAFPVHPNSEGDEKHTALREALSMLKPAQQECIRLMYLEDHSYQEIANITGFSMKKVKSHIQNGKRKLKIILDKSLIMISLILYWWLS